MNLIITKTENKVNYLYKFFSNFYKENEELTIYYGLDSAPLNHNGKKTILNKKIRLNKKDILDLLYFLEPYQQKGYGVFFTPNAIKGYSRGKSGVTRVSCLFADFDIKDLSSSERRIKKTEIMNCLSKAKLTPSKIVETCHGLHCYWFNNEVSVDMFYERQNGFYNYLEQKVLPKGIVCDPQAKSINNLLRVPTFFHVKDMNSPFLISEIVSNDKFFSLSELKTEKCVKEQSKSSKIGSCDDKRANINPTEREKKEESQHPISLSHIIDNIRIPETYFNKELKVNLFDGKDFFYFLSEYDLRDILNIRHGKEKQTYCRCPFHDDANASAIISQNDNGKWAIYCFSSNCPEGGKYLKVIDVLKKSLNINNDKQLTKILCEKLNVSLNKRHSEFVTSRIKNNKYQIKNLGRYPHLRSIATDDVMRIFYFILDKFKKHSTSNDYLLVDGNPCIFQGMSNISKETGIDIDKANKIVNLLCLLKFFKKISFKKIPKQFVPKTINGSKYDTQITYLSLPDYTKYFKKEANEDAYFLIQNGVKSYNFVSKKNVLNKLGKNYFNRCFSDSNWSISIHVEAELTYETMSTYKCNEGFIDFSKDITPTVKLTPPNRKPRGSSLISFLKKNIEIDFGRKE